MMFNKFKCISLKCISGFSSVFKLLIFIMIYFHICLVLCLFIYFLFITAQIFAHLIDGFWSHDWLVTPSCQLIVDSWYYCRTEVLWGVFTCLEPRLLGSSIHVRKKKISRQIANFGDFWCIFCHSSFIMTCTRNIPLIPSTGKTTGIQSVFLLIGEVCTTKFTLIT